MIIFFFRTDVVAMLWHMVEKLSRRRQTAGKVNVTKKERKKPNSKVPRNRQSQARMSTPPPPPQASSYAVIYPFSRQPNLFQGSTRSCYNTYVCWLKSKLSLKLYVIWFSEKKVLNVEKNCLPYKSLLH